MRPVVIRRCFAVLIALTAHGACSGNGTSSPATTTSTSTTKPASAPSTSYPNAPYDPVIDPAKFSTTIDNPYLPLVPGTRFVYDGTTEDGNERTVTEVTRDTKTIIGVTCVVVHDVVSVDGEVIEDTFDWYAQDNEGNVWYFGEDTKAFSGTKVDTAGSFEAGVDGAKPGIVMEAVPQIGDSYRQEYYVGVAEDRADVLSLTETASVAAGSYDNVLLTKDYSFLEPDVVENKYYAKGVGFVLVVHVTGSAERVELTAIEHF